MGDQRMFQIKKKKAITKEEKAALFLLLIIGGLGVVFGFKSFSATLSRPFEIQLSKYTGEDVLTISQQEAAEIERQKITDTDGDGLSDYDELYVYKTSPYLADSDSDGFDDKMEIFSNNDPNCPEGKVCNNTLATADDTTEIVTPATGAQGGSDLFSQLFGGTSGTATDTNFESVDDIISFFSKMDIDQVRSMLISQGIPQESVDQMTDQQVRDLLNSALEEAKKSGELDALVSPSEAADTTSDTNSAVTTE